jgi:hypothetical protein
MPYRLSCGRIPQLEKLTGYLAAQIFKGTVDDSPYFITARSWPMITRKEIVLDSFLGNADFFYVLSKDSTIGSGPET